MFQAKDYNALPSVDAAHEVMETLGPVRERLCTIIEKFGLNDKFGVRLIHKHFAMEEGETPVFRPVEVPGVCTAILMGPIKAGAIHAPLYGKNFLVLNAGGPLVPFEFTTAPCEDPNTYAEFLTDFSKELIDSKAEKVLGLCTDPKSMGENYTEFEMDDKRSTVMVPEHIVPSEADDIALITNWAVGDPAFPGMPEPMDACIKTRSGKHHGTCRKTRNSHHKTGALDNEALDSAFMRALREVGSPLHQVVQMVSACA